MGAGVGDDDVCSSSGRCDAESDFDVLGDGLPEGAMVVSVDSKGHEDMEVYRVCNRRGEHVSLARTGS